MTRRSDDNSDIYSQRAARPFGLIANEPEAMLIARRLTAAGRRVLHVMLSPAARLGPGPNLEAAATPADIAIECDTIAIAIDDTRVFLQLLLGTPERPGLMNDLAPGTVLIDFGIRPPREAQSILGITGLRGVSVVDAALIGGGDALSRGTAKVLVGGYPDAVDAATPLLCELGTIERTGPLGSAQTAAALMGYVEAAHFAARADAMTFGTALGLQTHALTRILDDAPEEQNVVRFQRRAELAYKIAEERGLGGDVVAFRRLGPVETPTESG
ncbi:MAG: NAD(P)-binding domain-containing protein [Hyphomicrobium sp.]